MASNTDIRLLFATRIVRMFSYGLLAVILALYLAQLGVSDAGIGLLLTLTLLGDTLISLWITTRADRVGRKRMLLIGAALMVFAGILFAVTRNFYLLLLAATIGVINRCKSSCYSVVAGVVSTYAKESNKDEAG
jgi:MFS family permease